jgi:drug/metabolite transporter (DMT)-like permease
MAALASAPLAPAAVLSPTARGVLWGLTAVAIWGVYLAFARQSVSNGLAPADLAFVRFLVAGALLLPWLLRRSPATLAGVGWRRGAALALLAGPLFILVGASGFIWAPLSHGAVVQPAALTVAGLALGALVLGDRLTRPRLVGAAVILAGLPLVAGPEALGGGGRALIGDGLFALAGVMWAGFGVLCKRWSVPPMAATAVVSVLAALIYTPVHLATRGVDALLTQPPAVLLQLAIVQGVLSGVVAVFAFGKAVEALGAPRAAAFPALVPVVAVVAGALLSGEAPLPVQTAGLLVVTFGLLINQRRPSA